MPNKTPPKLKACPSCQKQVSLKATTCPQCGEPLRLTAERKNSYGCFIIAIIFTLIICAAMAFNP